MKIFIVLTQHTVTPQPSQWGTDAATCIAINVRGHKMAEVGKKVPKSEEFTIQALIHLLVLLKVLPIIWLVGWGLIIQ